jgi:two-component system KDP operon response regulator KdpE
VNRVLAVDDSHVIRRLVEVSLDPLNILVETAGTGGEACDRLLASRPDLLILDLGLPDMPGWQVLEYARSEPALDGLPVILLTGYDDADDRDRAEAHMVEAYLETVPACGSSAYGSRRARSRRSDH